ncbi:hypothetical protein JEQ12_012079 [Ovis aries]|uniref:Uncharacterized protein n=1 Tax=Ovis aries TaxID=9940 RepID=A0A835ZRE7_SHEEP|nr:hypothetical protein JEQ12_012079 [Ovis aries]
MVTHTPDIITLVHIGPQSSLYGSLEEREAKPEVLPRLGTLSGSSWVYTRSQSLNIPDKKINTLKDWLLTLNLQTQYPLKCGRVIPLGLKIRSFKYPLFECPLESASQVQKKAQLEPESPNHGRADCATLLLLLPIISVLVLLPSELDKICFGTECEIYWKQRRDGK